RWTESFLGRRSHKQSEVRGAEPTRLVGEDDVLFAAQVHPSRVRIARPMTQSLSSSDRKLSSSVKMRDPLPVGGLGESVGEVGSPVAAPRTKGVETALQMLAHVAPRIALE